MNTVLFGSSNIERIVMMHLNYIKTERTYLTESAMFGLSEGSLMVCLC